MTKLNGCRSVPPPSAVPFVAPEEGMKTPNAGSVYMIHIYIYVYICLHSVFVYVHHVKNTTCESANVSIYIAKRRQFLERTDVCR